MGERDDASPLDDYSGYLEYLNSVQWGGGRGLVVLYVIDAECDAGYRLKLKLNYAA